ncbi:hypothetical protein ACFLR4_00925 [Bacteroidota bacterium]
MKSNNVAANMILILFIIVFCLMQVACEKSTTTDPETPAPPDTSSTPDPVDPPFDDGGDLSIRYIHRLPEVDYVWNSSNPAVEGWPLEGQEIIWRAVAVNWASHQRDSVGFAWFMDGAEIESGTISMLAGEETLIDFNWNWTFDRHEIEFIIDPLNKLEEGKEENNSLSFFTDAITVGFYVEQSVYDYYLNYYSPSYYENGTLDDWLHKQIDRLNLMCEDAVYNTSPEGVIDRFRIDKITIVGDGALPLVPLTNIPPEDASPGTHPNIEDYSVDIQWGFTAEGLSANKKDADLSKTSIFHIDGQTLLHELGHARYLTDVYAFRLYHGVYSDSVLVKENGDLIAGSPYMPGIIVHYTGPQGSGEGLTLYRTGIEGLMNQSYSFMDQHSAVALNLIAGQRAVCGNYNEPCNIGCYLNDLPSQNRLTLKSNDGSILAGAEVEIYQAEGVPGSGTFYSRRIDNIADLHFTADGNGQILIGRNPFSSDVIEQDWEVSNTTAVIRVEFNGSVGYNILDVSDFNLAYWEGSTGQADYEVTFNLIDP